MKKNCPTLNFFLLIFCFAVSASLVEAQATRTWVSGVGDDVNPCSRTAPCKTFAGAISKTAVNGEINCLDPAGFGTLTITKSITIDCTGTFGSALASMTNGFIINGATASVRLRGLQINGGGNGINGVRVISASRVAIENVVIDNFLQNGITVENSGSVQVLVSNSSIRNNTGNGINAAPTGSADITVSRSLIAGNATGLTANGNASIRITGNTVTYNTTGLSALKGGKIISFKDNAIDGNGTNGAPSSTVALQ
jgi:hypothetical protein